MNDTVFALATPPGRGAIAIVRISGPGAGPALETLSRGRLPAPRRASVRRLWTGVGELIDEAVVLWQPGPASYTGEDSVELHLHGGPAVVAAAAGRLADLGLRTAEPGEFTRRGFEHGRMDLAQAEAVADLIEAETSAQRNQALSQLGGVLSARYEAWRSQLLDVLALLEAAIDFPDEDIPPSVQDTARNALTTLECELAEAAGDMRGEQVRTGLYVVLVGAPNAGKSSLLNALIGREAAIVTPTPGTTRDVVEGACTIADQLVRLADTAGLRETEDLIEAEGVRRARDAARDADLRIGVYDRTQPESAAEALAVLRPGDFLALNKSDLASSTPISPHGVGPIETVATPEGVNALRTALAERITLTGVSGDAPAVTRLRHRQRLQEAAEHLAHGLVQLGRASELAAEDVRLAIRSLERVTGQGDPEAVLDRVFASFCVGK